jgi:hypothetical protein
MTESTKQSLSEPGVRLGLVYLLPTLVSFLLGFWFAGFIVRSSAFVTNSPIQYSELIFRFYIAVLSTTICATGIILAVEDHTARGKACRFFSQLPLVLAGGWLYFKPFTEQPWDVFGILLMFSAAMSGIASFFEIERNEPLAGKQFVFVELPLFIGAFIAVLLKRFYYFESSDSFIEFAVQKLMHEWHLPDKGEAIKEAEQLFREHFWQGITVGVLMIQLLSAQITAIFIRFQKKNGGC